MHTARFELTVAFSEADLTHDIEGHIVEPVIDRDGSAAELGDLVDEEVGDSIQSG